MITRTPPTTTILVVAVVCALAGSIIRAAGLGRVVRTATPLPHGMITSSPPPPAAAGRRWAIYPRDDDDGSSTTNDAVEERGGPKSAATMTMTTTKPSPPHPRTALSIPPEELSDILGGRGRARLAWDCYSEGADPQYLFAPPPSQQWREEQQHLATRNEYADAEHAKGRILPTPRRTQVLGASALGMLSDLHSHCGGSIEGGLATLVHVSTSADGTTKMLLRLSDGLEVETVLIPFWSDDGNEDGTGRGGEGGGKKGDDSRREGRTTVCVSSQVGCKQGCTFCATGKMGRIRSLTSDEILAQLFFAKKVVRLGRDGDGGAPDDRPDEHDDGNNGRRSVVASALPKISNVVFMGMGEPSDNAQAVRGAIDVMTRNGGFQLSASRVTVSTVAPCPGSFAEFADSRCVLAWSVHAARDDLRRRLVPTTRHTMVELREGLMNALRNRTLKTCMIEVALMDGVNDSLREAEELADFLNHIIDNVPGSKVVCNLIPYNDIGSVGMGYAKPSRERVIAFQRRMQESGIQAHVRGTRGDDESAACGQLVTSRTRAAVKST